MSESRKLAYVYLTETDKVNAIKPGVHADKEHGVIYFDTMILTNEKTGFKSVLTTYGDGAHMQDVGFFKDGGKGEFMVVDVAYHNMQLERSINEATDILALAEGKVVYLYRKGDANHERK